MEYAFAGDRDISVEILKYLLSNDNKPLALLLTSRAHQSHSEELKSLCPFLDSSLIFEGKDFNSESSMERIASLNLDYIFGIHFPYIIPSSFLNIPKFGFLNLHPAFLPYNKGWHTPSWAIYDGSKYGATLHFMSEDLDSGDIILS